MIRKLRHIYLILTVTFFSFSSFGQDYTFDDFVGTWHGTYSSAWSGIYNLPMTMTIYDDGFYTETTGHFMPSIYPNTQQCEYQASTDRFHWWYLDIVYSGQYFYQHFFYDVVYFQNDTLEMHYNFWNDSIPNPEAGTLFLVKELTTGLSEIIAESPRIYPNPASDFVYLKAEEAVQSIRIFNQSGQVLKSSEGLSLSDQKIDVSNLPSGVYTLIIETGSGFISEKLMIH